MAIFKFEPGEEAPISQESICWGCVHVRICKYEDVLSKGRLLLNSCPHRQVPDSEWPHREAGYWDGIDRAARWLRTDKAVEVFADVAASGGDDAEALATLAERISKLTRTGKPYHPSDREVF